MAERSDDLVSEAVVGQQESGAESASAVASEGKATVQEQKSEGATVPTKDDLASAVEKARKEAADEAAEKVRREMQSVSDKRIHQLEMQMEAERQKQEAAARQAEEARLAQLDDEDFGREMRKLREQQARQAEAAANAQEVFNREALKERQRVIALIPQENMDEFLRRENEEVHSYDEFKSFSLEYLSDLKAQQKLKKQLEARAKAEQNDSLAQTASLAAPVVSTGQYQHSSKPQTPDELLSEGIEEAKATARKRRGE